MECIIGDVWGVIGGIKDRFMGRLWEVIKAMKMM